MKLPNLSRNRIVVWNGIVDILEGLGDWGACLRIVSRLQELDIFALLYVHRDCDIRWQVELGIQGASPMTLLNALRGGELPDIRRARRGPLKTLVDAVTC